MLKEDALRLHLRGKAMTLLGALRAYDVTWTDEEKEIAQKTAEALDAFLGVLDGEARE